MDRYLNFKLESGTSVYKSCTATMNGGTFVFGGHYDDNEKSVRLVNNSRGLRVAVNLSKRLKSDFVVCISEKAKTFNFNFRTARS